MISERRRKEWENEDCATEDSSFFPSKKTGTGRHVAWLGKSGRDNT